MASRPVVIDTNFLLIPFQFKINMVAELDLLIERNHHYVISSRTIRELTGLSKRIGRHGAAARLALKMVEVLKKDGKLQIIQSERPVDAWLVEYALANNAIVCTNDDEVRHALRSVKKKVISMKSKSKIDYV